MILPDDFDIQFTREQLATGCETMRRLLRGLLDSKGKVSEEVHAIRKLGKSLRGGFALFRLEKSSGMEIQAIGRILSESRDAVSRLNTWNKLAWVGDPAVSKAISGLLEQQTHSAARRPPVETMDWCVARVDEALSHLNLLPAANLAEIVRTGLDKLGKRVIKRCRKLDHQAQEDFHEARKAVKAWTGAIGHMPHGTIPLDPKLQEIAELLGDENDLATLSVWLEKHGFTRNFAPDLWKTLKSARHGLQKRAIKEAAGLRED